MPAEFWSSWIKIENSNYGEDRFLICNESSSLRMKYNWEKTEQIVMEEWFLSGTWNRIEGFVWALKLI
jgi:hypothetical protein